MNSPVALITGATRGIGFAAAKQLTALGAKVIIASRDLSRAQKAAEELGTDSVQVDITDDASLKASAEALAERYGHLDILVNNSAILIDHYESITDLKPQTLNHTFDTNVTGTLRATLAFLHLLKKSEEPRIINLSSGAGQLNGEPMPWAPAYSISKTALNMLTQQLTAALPDIMVNSMCPGWCRTEMGGEEAPLTAEQGADTIVWLATEAPHTLRGGFVKERKVIAW